ncbi:hypothetical protein AB0H42_33625 [Nocardia sp. NPDC050799]|uniref:hypothetical protein n=1 Tax=Nocardia sp. NPDC050799 TaxID=3154842 RepID=UPI0033D47BA6
MIFSLDDRVADLRSASCSEFRVSLRAFPDVTGDPSFPISLKQRGARGTISITASLWSSADQLRRTAISEHNSADDVGELAFQVSERFLVAFLWVPAAAHRGDAGSGG